MTAKGKQRERAARFKQKGLKRRKKRKEGIWWIAEGLGGLDENKTEREN